MNVTILVIEQDPDLALLFASILSVEGYTVVPASSIDEANNALTTQELQAIVYDCPNSYANGYQWLNKLRDSPRSAAIPILLICDEMPVRAQREFLWNLNIPAMEKPFDLRTFCRTLEGIMPIRERLVGAY